MFALKNVALTQGAGDLLGLAEALVIPLLFASEIRVHGMMKVVTPNSVQSIATLLSGSCIARIVLVGLGNHVDGAFQFAGQC